jgi:hypothetical protein
VSFESLFCRPLSVDAGHTQLLDRLIRLAESHSSDISMDSFINAALPVIQSLVTHFPAQSRWLSSGLRSKFGFDGSRFPNDFSMDEMQEFLNNSRDAEPELSMEERIQMEQIQIEWENWVRECASLRQVEDMISHARHVIGPARVSERLGSDRPMRAPSSQDDLAFYSSLGLSALCAQFGLSAKRFGENLSRAYRQHEVVDPDKLPQQAVNDFLASIHFSDCPEVTRKAVEQLEKMCEKTSQNAADMILAGVRMLVAADIENHPLVRESLRRDILGECHINSKKTAKGRERIDPFHIHYPVSCIVNKPMSDFKDEMWLAMLSAEKSGFIEVISLAFPFPLALLCFFISVLCSFGAYE